MTGRNDINGDCGLGHLTFKGYKQQELNGHNLRSVYVETGFLSPNYSSHEVFFRTDGKYFYSVMLLLKFHNWSCSECLLNLKNFQVRGLLGVNQTAS